MKHNFMRFSILLTGFWFALMTITATAQNAGNGRFVLGKNQFTIEIDGDTREYLLHVPRKYNKSAAVPVVFMLHGTSGNGERFYNGSGWKELGEEENIITVFPSSWRYCIIDEGIRKNTTKWNIYPGTFEYCKGEKPKDDIKFFNKILDELERTFNINKRKIYFVGFSNGGQMSARVAVEMSDRVAAVVSASGPLHGTTLYKPKRFIPNLLQLGNTDRLFIQRFFGGKPIPMDFDELFQSSPQVSSVVKIYQQTFQLSSDCRRGGDPNKTIWMECRSLSAKNNGLFRFDLIKGMGHIYPRGMVFSDHGAKGHWEWLKQFELPQK